jgi:hypothetical protein
VTQESPGFNEDGTPVQMTKRKKAALVADKVIVQGVLGNTVGRVGRLAGRLLLGRIPDNAKEGSFQEEKPVIAVEVAESQIETRKTMETISEADKAILEDEIFDQVFAQGNKAPVTSEREWKVGEPEKPRELSTV